MKILSSLILVWLAAGAAHSQHTRPTWRGITPLHSSRADVESAVKGLELVRDSTFEGESETVSFRYIAQPCVSNGWSVKPGTVLDYTVSPKKQTRIELVDRFKDLVRTADHGGYSYYTDREHGLQYSIDSLRNIKSVRYVPSLKNSGLRCEGFPAYDAVTEMYVPYDRILLKGKKENIFDTVSLLSQVDLNPNSVGYIFIYLKRDSPKSQKGHYLAEARKFVYETSKRSPERIKVAFGGYRDQSEIEMFFLPNDYPAPMPMPKYTR